MFKKFNILKHFAVIFAVIVFSFSAAEYGNVYAANAPVKTTVYASQKVSPVDVVNCPSKYLNKTITFDADFVTYSALGLDYKPALRESTKYIGVLIKRDDVKDHVIPLSEMKLFLSREVAEKNSELENGDKIRITGTVFSNALGDPWIDIKTFNVVQQKNKSK